MKLLRVHVISAKTCGGLLDGLDLWLRSPNSEYELFDPMCLIGQNGTGKSQFLQVVAEIFQSAFHSTISSEERIEGNHELQFEVEYLIRPEGAKSDVHVRIARIAEGKKRLTVVIQKHEGDDWIDCSLTSTETWALLPRKIVGYTSGGNETLSLPFLLSRSGYATEVGERALKEVGAAKKLVPDTRLMLIDYSTHLEVLVANLLLASADQRMALLADARVEGLHSFRCVVQLAHSAAPKAPSHLKGVSSRKGIQLTEELEGYLTQLQRCATCHDYDDKTETYTFDFFVDQQTTKAFTFFWDRALELYSALHKLAMLNDLAIPKGTRDRFKRDTKARRFASKLPEPQDEDKVFRFEQVSFRANLGKSVVDYVSLSDGEHQLAQLLGTFCMVSFPNVLFLLDEPESHFNPQWRVKFMSRLLDLPTAFGVRREKSLVAQQDCLLTTHAPFVPSDMPRDKVFIFGKDGATGRIAVRQPDVETFGTTFDAILSECFDVHPPISDEPRKEIKELMASKDVATIKAGMERLGNSVDKVLLGDRVRQLLKEEEK